VHKADVILVEHSSELIQNEPYDTQEQNSLLYNCTGELAI